MRRKFMILFDKFHVMRHLGVALGWVRKSEYRRLSGRDRSYIKGQNTPRSRMRTKGATIRVRHGGSSPPLLPLHGYPNNHVVRGRGSRGTAYGTLPRRARRSARLRRLLATRSRPQAHQLQEPMLVSGSHYIGQGKIDTPSRWPQMEPTASTKNRRPGVYRGCI
jgi:hypothetical protein